MLILLLAEPKAYFYFLIIEKFDFRKKNYSFMNSNLLQTSNLGDIYPEISEELCNKHAKLLSQLKNRFSDLYDEFQPEKYIFVNGVAKIIDFSNEFQLSFAIENGVCLLFRKTYKNQEIYINGNHIEQELIFNNKGKHIEGIHENIDQIKEMIKIIRKNGDKNKQYYGGILYVHTNIGQELFSFRQCFLLSIFIGLLKIHEEDNRYSKIQIIEILRKVDEKLNINTIQNILQDYEIGKMHANLINTVQSLSGNQIDINICNPFSDKSIKTHESNQSIKSNTENNSLRSSNSGKQVKQKEISAKSHNSIESLEEQNEVEISPIPSTKSMLDLNNKLILCKLDISKEELQHYSSRMQRIREIRAALEQSKISNFDPFDESEILSKSSQLSQILSQEEIQLLRYYEQMKELLGNLVNKRIQFTDFLNQKHELDERYDMFDQEVVGMIYQIQKEAKFLKNFCIVSGTVLLISIEKQYYAQVMRFLRKLFNDYRFSTYRFLQTKNKINEDKNGQIGEFMFTTSPSKGFAIYDPTDCLWI